LEGYPIRTCEEDENGVLDEPLVGVKKEDKKKGKKGK
jgi:hypothetical protein